VGEPPPGSRVGRSGTAPPARGRTRRGTTSALFAHDRRLGERLVAGADEAGRGALAGPLVAAAVCLDLDRLRGSARRALAGLDDSKTLPPRERERLADAVHRVAVQVVVVSAACATIDREGLHRTNLRLLARALALLDPCPGVCLVDGFRLGPEAPPHRAVAGGDARSACIAAASVIAKVTRDRLMAGPVCDAHPGYGFETHVGYSTPAHRAVLAARGPSPLHRLSFRSCAYGEGIAPDDRRGSDDVADLHGGDVSRPAAWAVDGAPARPSGDGASVWPGDDGPGADPSAVRPTRPSAVRPAGHPAGAPPVRLDTPAGGPRPDA